MSSTALRRYSDTYEQLARVCQQLRFADSDTRLRAVETVGTYASVHHPGKFGDGRIENVALEIGRHVEEVSVEFVSKLLGTTTLRRPGYGVRRVLHVTPVIWRVGGHTRTLVNWITLDRESQHFVLITQRADETLLSEFRHLVRSRGGDVFVLPPSLQPVEKAAVLRTVARQCADLIVLHHTCNDVIPLAAFAVDDTPPVTLVNDCDQAFWIGSPSIDLVIHQRDAGARIAHRRFVDAHFVLPIPLLPPCSPPGREAARAALGFGTDDLVLLTVGRAIKYRPSETHDFLRTARRILDRVPKAHLMVVGVTEREAAEWQLDFRHPRVTLCGPISDLASHRAAADLYLESMPFGSATALMEAAMVGLPVVLPFAPPFELFVTNHGIEAIVSNPPDEGEYVDHVVDLLAHEQQRAALGYALRVHMQAHHTGDGWRARLKALYDTSRQLVHTPREIPSPPAMAEILDIELSRWHAALEAEQSQDVRAGRWLIRELAAMAWRTGDYLGAAEIAGRYVVQGGLARRSPAS